MSPKPLYQSNSFEEFSKNQKLAGLRKEFWKDLPKMWERELKFRKKLEKALIFYETIKN